MESTQLRNVDFQSTANEWNEGTPAWARDPTVALLAFFAPRSRKIRATKYFTSELAQWRKAKLDTLKKLKGVPRRIMMFLKTEASCLDSRILLECDLEEEIISLIALYMDFELRILHLLKKEQEQLKLEGKDPQNKSIQDAQYFPKYEQWLINRISRWLYTLLPAHDRRVDALLSITVYSRKTQAVLDPLFRKVLWETPKGPLNSVSYVRHMIAYKIWRERVLVAEDEGSKTLSGYVRLHLHPKDFKSFPRPLLRCLGRGGTHEKHARPNNINLKDACLYFKQCKDFPDTISDAINYESLEIFKTKGDEVDELMDMITERKNKRKTVCTAVIDLTSEDVIDLTIEDDLPSTSTTSPLRLECANYRMNRTLHGCFQNYKPIVNDFERASLKSFNKTNNSIVRSFPLIQQSSIDMEISKDVSMVNFILPKMPGAITEDATPIASSTMNNLPQNNAVLNVTTVPKVSNDDGKDSHSQEEFLQLKGCSMETQEMDLPHNNHTEVGPSMVSEEVKVTAAPDVATEDVVNLVNDDILQEVSINGQHLQDEDSIRPILIKESTVPEVSTKGLVNLENDNSSQDASTENQHTQDEESIRPMLTIKSIAPEVSIVEPILIKESTVPEVSTEDVVNLENNNSLQEASKDNQYIQNEESFRPIKIKESTLPEVSTETNLKNEDSLQEDIRPLVINESTENGNSSQDDLTQNQHIQNQETIRPNLINETTVSDVSTEDCANPENDNNLQEVSTDDQHYENEDSSTSVLTKEPTVSEVFTEDLTILENDKKLQQVSIDKQHVQDEESIKPVLITESPEVSTEDLVILENYNSLQEASTDNQHIQDEKESTVPEVSTEVLVNFENDESLHEVSTNGQHLQDEESTVPEVSIEVNLERKNKLQELSINDQHRHYEDTIRPALLNEATVIEVVTKDLVNFVNDNRLQEASPDDQRLQDEECIRSMLIKEPTVPDIPTKDLVIVENDNQHLQDEKSNRPILIIESTEPEVNTEEVVNLKNEIKSPGASIDDQHLQDESIRPILIKESLVPEVVAENVLENENKLQEASIDDQHLEDEESIRPILIKESIVPELVTEDVVILANDNILQEPSADSPRLQDEDLNRAKEASTVDQHLKDEKSIQLEELDNCADLCQNNDSDLPKKNEVIRETIEDITNLENNKLQKASKNEEPIELQEVVNSCADLSQSNAPEFPKMEILSPKVSEVFREVNVDDDSSQDLDTEKYDALEIDEQDNGDIATTSLLETVEQEKDLQESVQRLESLVVQDNGKPIELNTASCIEEGIVPDKPSQELIKEDVVKDKELISSFEEKRGPVISSRIKTVAELKQNYEDQNKKRRSIMHFNKAEVFKRREKKITNSKYEKKIVLQEITTEQKKLLKNLSKNAISPKIQLLRAVELVPLSAEEDKEIDFSQEEISAPCDKIEEKAENNSVSKGEVDEDDLRLSQIRMQMEPRADGKIKRRKNGIINSLNNDVVRGGKQNVSVAKRKKLRPSKLFKDSLDTATAHVEKEDILAAAITVTHKPLKSSVKTVEQKSQDPQPPRRRKQSLKDTLTWDRKELIDSCNNLSTKERNNFKSKTTETEENQMKKRPRGRPVKNKKRVTKSKIEPISADANSDDEVPLLLRVAQKQHSVEEEKNEHISRELKVYEAKNCRSKRFRLAKCVARFAVSDQMKDSSESPSPSRDSLEGEDRCEKSKQTENIKQVLLPTSPVEKSLALEISAPKVNNVRSPIKLKRKNTDKKINRGRRLAISSPKQNKLPKTKVNKKYQRISKNTPKISQREPELVCDNRVESEIISVKSEVSEIISEKPVVSENLVEDLKNVSTVEETIVIEEVSTVDETIEIEQVSTVDETIEIEQVSTMDETIVIEQVSITEPNQAGGSLEKQNDLIETEMNTQIDKEVKSDIKEMPTTIVEEITVPEESPLIPSTIADLFKKCNSVEPTPSETDCTTNILRIDETLDTAMDTEKNALTEIQVEQVQEEPIPSPALPLDLSLDSKKEENISTIVEEPNKTLDELVVESHVEETSDASKVMMQCGLELLSEMLDSSVNSSEVYNPVTSDISSEEIKIADHVETQTSCFNNPKVQEMSHTSLPIMDICSELEIPYAEHSNITLSDNYKAKPTCGMQIPKMSQEENKMDVKQQLMKTLIFNVIGEEIISLRTYAEDQQLLENTNKSSVLPVEEESNKCLSIKNEQQFNQLDVPALQNEVILGIPEVSVSNNKRGDGKKEYVKVKDVAIINESDNDNLLISNLIEILDFEDTRSKRARQAKQAKQAKNANKPPVSHYADNAGENCELPVIHIPGDPLTPPNSNDVTDFGNFLMLADTAAALKPGFKNKLKSGVSQLASELKQIAYQPYSPPTEPDPSADEKEKNTQPKEKEQAKKNKTRTQRKTLRRITLENKTPSPPKVNTSGDFIRRTRPTKMKAGNSKSKPDDAVKVETKSLEADDATKQKYQEYEKSCSKDFDELMKEYKQSLATSGDSSENQHGQVKKARRSIAKEPKQSVITSAATTAGQTEKIRTNPTISKQQSFECAFDPLEEENKETTENQSGQTSLECVINKSVEEIKKSPITSAAISGETKKVEDVLQEAGSTIPKQPSFECAFDQLREENKESMIATTENQSEQTYKPSFESVFDDLVEEIKKSETGAVTTAGQTKKIEEASQETDSTVSAFDQLREENKESSIPTAENSSEHKNSLNTTPLNAITDFSCDSSRSSAEQEKRIGETPQLLITETCQPNLCTSTQGIGHDWLIGDYIETIVESTERESSDDEEIQEKLSKYTRHSGPHENCCLIEHEVSDNEESNSEHHDEEEVRVRIDMSNIDWSKVDLSKIDWSKIDMETKSLIEGSNNRNEREDNQKRKIAQSLQDEEHLVNIKKQKIAETLQDEEHLDSIKKQKIAESLQDEQQLVSIKKQKMADDNNRMEQAANNHVDQEELLYYLGDSPSDNGLLCTEIFTEEDGMYYDTLEMFKQDQEQMIKNVDEDSEAPHKIQTDYCVADRELPFSEIFSWGEMTLVDMNNLQPQNGSKKEEVPLTSFSSTQELQPIVEQIVLDNLEKEPQNRIANLPMADLLPPLEERIKNQTHIDQKPRLIEEKQFQKRNCVEDVEMTLVDPNFIQPQKCHKKEELLTEPQEKQALDITPIEILNVPMREPFPPQEDHMKNKTPNHTNTTQLPSQKKSKKWTKSVYENQQQQQKALQRERELAAGNLFPSKMNEPHPPVAKKQKIAAQSNPKIEVRNLSTIWKKKQDGKSSDKSKEQRGNNVIPISKFVFLKQSRNGNHRVRPKLLDHDLGQLLMNNFDAGSSSSNEDCPARETPSSDLDWIQNERLQRLIYGQKEMRQFF